MENQITLKRTLSLPMVVLYGLGTTIGAGIYALVGEIANVAGYYAPFSFFIAALLAGFTAISFAELCGRFPRAAGAALYVKQAFTSERLSTVIGLLVITAGVVSAAALVNGFVGYLHQLISVDRIIAITIVTILLASIASWGIAESVTIASIITVVEIGGLLLVISVSGESLSTLPNRWTELLPSADMTSWGGIYFGAVLSFYAFIGFEDMVDVAEEVKNVKHNLPRAILLTLLITTVIYMLLMVTAVLSLTPAELASSQAPLASIYEHHVGEKAVVIGIIGMLAIINGALIQIIMAARVLYGMGSRGQLPGLFSHVYQRTRTPLIATLVASSLVLILALTGRLATLAEATSIIILTVFSIVNLALWQIKRRDPQPVDVKTYPTWIPVIGFFISFAFVLGEVIGLLKL
ncbi:MAG: amino acid permease [Pseudomonadales bacterium]|nr:amino acid permease [Pseudomonadales bacterium]